MIFFIAITFSSFDGGFVDVCLSPFRFFLFLVVTIFLKPCISARLHFFGIFISPFLALCVVSFRIFFSPLFYVFNMLVSIVPIILLGDFLDLFRILGLVFVVLMLHSLRVKATTGTLLLQ